MKNLIDKIRNLSTCSVCVIGDIMLDVYISGDTDRISPEAPVPILKINRRTEVLGGAGNVVRNLSALGAKVNFIGVIGNDDNGKKINSLLGDIESVVFKTEVINNIPTIVKSRFIAQGQQLLRADEEQNFQMTNDLEERLLNHFHIALDFCNIVIISDYDKGVVSSSLSKAVIQMATQKSIPVFVDPKGNDLLKYFGATLIKPNRKELSRFFGGVDVSGKERFYSQELLVKAQSQYCLVTLGKDGMILTSKDGDVPINAIKREVYDVTGAGDTVIATLAALYGAGIAMEDAVFLSNMTAGIAITKTGTAIVTMEELLRDIDLNKKIFSVASLLNVVDMWKKNDLSIGFTNGCFDLIHTGHISMLKFCKENCDRLIVALNSDQSVKRLKGQSRPINDENQRAVVLSEFSSIDAIVVFDDNTPESLINIIKPDLLIKGGDYSKDNIVGAEFVESYGGRVITSPYINGFSSTKILKNIENSR